MRKTYEEKAAEIEALLAETEQELASAPDERARGPLLARKGSLQGSLNWYRARTPRARPIQSIGAYVADAVSSGEALG